MSSALSARLQGHARLCKSIVRLMSAKKTAKSTDRAAEQSWRGIAASAQRVVVKVGTRALVQGSGRPDGRRIAALAMQLAAMRKAGREVVLVSSGAIGAGMDALGLRSRPQTLPELQMAAAVGQSRLMARYDQELGRVGCRVGQVLLTHGDLKHRVRHLNARNTLMRLLHHGIIPVVNENDVVSVDEIKFGDNDHLASLVTMLIDADLLVLLTSVDGLRRAVTARTGSGRRTQRVCWLPVIDEVALGLTWGQQTTLSVGGMLSKLQAAQTAAAAGAMVIIADGRRKDTLNRIVEGRSVGTLIPPLRADGQSSAVRSRKRWIAYFQRASGALIVDEGARTALQRSGRSLLPIGIVEVEGSFDVGAVVNVRSEQGSAIARGLVGYSSAEIERIKGHHTRAISSLLGARPYGEVIHRDNMVVWKATPGRAVRAE